MPAQCGGDFSPWERDQIQPVFKKWLVSKFKSHIADAVSLPAVQTICSLSPWVLVFSSAYHYLLMKYEHVLLKQTTLGCPITSANIFDGHIYLTAYALSAEQNKLQLTQSTSDNAILTKYAMRFHNLTSGADSMRQRGGGTCPHFYKCLGMGEAPWVEEQQTRNWPNSIVHHESTHQND